MRLKELREKKALTQRDIGIAIGVEQHTVSQWETGDRTPRADKLPELARILGCTIDELFEDQAG